MTNHWFGGLRENLRVTIAGHLVLVVEFQRDAIAHGAPVGIRLIRCDGRHYADRNGWDVVDFGGDVVKFRVRYSEDPGAENAERCWITAQAPARFRFAWGDYRPSFRKLAPAPMKP